MSDASEAVAEALRLNRRLAATLLVKKQELESELAAGPAAGRAEVLAAELARVDAAYRAALAELDDLRGLGEHARADADRAVVTGALASDPILVTEEERVLDAARQHILELEAQASLTRPPDDQPERGAAPAPKTREEADRDARAEFEALRAQRAADAAAEPGKPRPRPKKTL
jgi:hypothetical protein